MNTLKGAREKWTEVFEDPNLSLDSLKARALSQHSNLGIDGIRSVCWKVYLGCIPTIEISTWPFVMTTERERYVELRQKYIRAIGADDGPEPDLELNNPLSLAEDSPWQQFFVDSELKKIIKQDVERTFPDNDYFRSEKVQDQLNDILFIYCKINHDVSYRQGMHELLAHILWVVSSESLDTQRNPGASSDATLDVMRSVLDSKFIEHDTFALFSSLMSRAKPWYEFSDEGFASKRPRPPNKTHNAQPFGKSDAPEPPPGKQTPVIEWSMKIFQYLERVDNELFLHLKSLEIQPQLFGIRWFRLLFGREFPMEDVLNLWDGIFAKDPSLNICIFIGLALLLRIRDELLEEDFAGCLHKLMRYPSVKDVHQFLPQALHLQKMPNAAGGQEIIRQNYVLAGKPLPPLPPVADADHGGQHYQQQQYHQNPYQQHQQHRDGSPSPIPQQRRQQHGGHHQDHHKTQSGSFPGNGVLSQHLPPAALDAIKPVAEGFVHVTKNVLESKGGAALNKAIHDMKKNTQSYIRKANAPSTASPTPDFPPMFEQVVSSVSRQSASSRHAPPPHQQTARQQPYQDSHTYTGGGSNNTDKQLQSQLGQIVAKALVILESEFVSSSTGGGGGDLSESTTTTANSSKESPDVGSGKSPSKAALAAISGLEHVRDILLGFTKDLNPLVIESGMLDKPATVVSPAAMPKAYNSPKTAAQATTALVERTPINATRQNTLHPNTRNSPSRSTSDSSIIERQGLSRNPSQASDLSGFSSSGDPQEYWFNTGGSGSTPSPPGLSVTTMAETYMPAPVPAPPAPKPFSFDDLLGDSTTDSTTTSSTSASRKGSPPSSRNKIGSGLANKVKSPRSSLANSQFSWMLDDSGKDGLLSQSTAAAKVGGVAGGGGGGATRSSMDLFSPGSSRMKIDPLAGSVSRGVGILGGGGSSAGPAGGAGEGGSDQALQDDDPLRA
ncbi:TBC1 domain, member 5 [Linnemannia schmuckeri]|uniref:TBC1 domain, member 5 n=1 Tax=Linnemannia schmuckeri TaxID=64567 RepID=A0A9P5S1Y6_9FUNG|nr:TBC1 domain, member 5 [Linnemannia schmuckeri]